MKFGNFETAAGVDVDPGDAKVARQRRGVNPGIEFGFDIKIGFIKIRFSSGHANGSLGTMKTLAMILNVRRRMAALPRDERGTIRNSPNGAGFDSPGQRPGNGSFVRFLP